jgi:hypothetical protein
MKFEHERHKKAYEQVQEYLGELFEDLYHDEENGHTYGQYGSTVLEISVDPYGPEDAIITVMAYCVQGVQVDEELLRNLLQLNHDISFGAFSLVGEDIFFSHSLFGRTLEPSNVLGALIAVADISDEYDDRIVARYGGQTALDRIRQTGGRRRRREAANN